MSLLPTKIPGWKKNTANHFIHTMTGHLVAKAWHLHMNVVSAFFFSTHPVAPAQRAWQAPKLAWHNLSPYTVFYAFRGDCSH
jgi:hypothetical protein